MEKVTKTATPLIVTAVLNSTRAADFRTGKVPGSEKPTPANPKGDRRSALSEKEIQESLNSRYALKQTAA